MAKKKLQERTDAELVEAAAQKAGGFEPLARELSVAYTTVYRWRGGTGKVKLTESRRKQLQQYLEMAQSAQTATASGGEQDAKGDGNMRETVQGTLAEWAREHNVSVPSSYHRLKRDGSRDLSFAGWLAGEGKFGYPGTDERKWERGRFIKIFVTAAGRMVVSIERWSVRPGETNQYAAGVFEDTASALVCLEEGSGKLMHASKAAWEEACRNCEALRDAETESIE